MWKNTLLLCFVVCTLLVSTRGQVQDQHDRLKDRIIHVETLLMEGRWLWQNDNTDEDGSYYLYYDELAEKNTYLKPRAQFKATACGKGGVYLCFESMSKGGYYLAAGFPPTAPDKYTVKLEKSTSVDNWHQFHWKVMCENDSLKMCKFYPVRFDNYVMVADNWGIVKGYGDDKHYDATLGTDENFGWVRVLAPNPTDKYVEIYTSSNGGTSDQTATYSTTVGVTQTDSTTNEISSTLSMEIGGAFKAVSASVSASISKSWTKAKSTAFQSSTSVSHTLTIPAGTKIVLKQLTGNYAGKFEVGNDNYMIEETPLAGGETLKSEITL